MADATIHHRWDEGGSVRLTFHVDTEHPDALDMCATRVLRMYREAVLEADEADDQ